MLSDLSAHAMSELWCRSAIIA